MGYVCVFVGCGVENLIDFVDGFVEVFVFGLDEI